MFKHTIVCDKCGDTFDVFSHHKKVDKKYCEQCLHDIKMENQREYYVKRKKGIT